MAEDDEPVARVQELVGGEIPRAVPPGQTGEEPEHRVLPVERPAPAVDRGHRPADIVGERIEDGGDVAAAEGGVGVADRVDVGRLHNGLPRWAVA